VGLIRWIKDKRKEKGLRHNSEAKEVCPESNWSFLPCKAKEVTNPERPKAKR
jgi:hypothetical protein